MERLIVEALDKERAGLGVFRVHEDFTHIDPVRGPITVPAGYETDFASIPYPCRWLIPSAGKSAKAALLHDWMKARSDNPRWATGVFNRALKQAGCGTLRRVVMVAFVACFTFVDLYL